MDEWRIPVTLPEAAAILSYLFHALSGAYRFFAHGSLFSVIFLAGFLRYAGRRIAEGGGAAPAWPKSLGMLAFLAVGLTGYLATRFPRHQEPEAYASLALRSYLALVIVQGAASILLPVLARLWFFLILAPRSVGSSLHQARRAYEAECRALRRARLDAEELEVALQFARQRYLRRIRGEIDDEE